MFASNVIVVQTMNQDALAKLYIRRMDADNAKPVTTLTVILLPFLFLV